MHLSLVTTRAVPDNQSSNNPSIADCLCEIADVCSRPPYNQPSPVLAGSLSDSDNLPAPEVIAAEIVEDLEAALEQFREILADMDGTSIEVQGA